MAIKQYNYIGGKSSKGKPIYKSIWKIDEETCSIARLIIVDMYTNKKMSYVAIRDYLNNNNIKNSSGGLWSTSTISSMLRPERLEQYNGTAFWNKENKQIKGIKYNDRSKWIICENAHPAIIDKQELQKALERKKNNNDAKYKPKLNSDYLFSDKNLEDEFMFICANCRGHVIGSSNGKNHNRNYTCSNNRHKGKCACDNNWKIDKDWLEDTIINEIERKYMCPKGIEKIVNNIYLELSSINRKLDKKIVEKEKEINKLEEQIQNLLNSIKSGVNPELVVNEINNLKNIKDTSANELLSMKNENKKSFAINKDQITKYFNDLHETFISANMYEKRELIKTFVRRIELDEKNHQISVEFYPDILVVPNIGAGSGNRTHVASLEGWGSTIELHLHLLATVINYRLCFLFCQHFF